MRTSVTQARKGYSRSAIPLPLRPAPVRAPVCAAPLCCMGGFGGRLCVTPRRRSCALCEKYYLALTVWIGGTDIERGL